MRVLVRTVTSLGIGTRVNEVIKALAATLNNNLATSAGTGLRLLSSRRHGWFRSRGGSGDFLASLPVETLALLADAQLSFLAFLVVAFARARPTSIRESSCTLTAAVGDNDATRLGALGLTLRRRKWRWLERWRDRRTCGGGGGARLGSDLTRRDTLRAIVAMVLFAFAYRNLVREIFVASTGTKAAGVGLERKEARESTNYSEVLSAMRVRTCKNTGRGEETLTKSSTNRQQSAFPIFPLVLVQVFSAT